MNKIEGLADQARRTPIEQLTALEIQREVTVLEEKARMADLPYRRMKDDEDSVLEYLKLPSRVHFLVPPPTPYAGLAEHLQSDLPHLIQRCLKERLSSKPQEDDSRVVRAYFAD
jgi:hypothetical protein